ncbi:coiled-coil domain-containing protein 170-like isoform X2 [Glandiceps talaboti]
MSYYRSREDPLDSLPHIPRHASLLESHHRVHSPTRIVDDSIVLDRLADERWIHNRSAPSALLRSPSPPVRPTTHSTHKLVHELHDQVKLYKSELEKKDRLISELSSTESPRLRRAFDDTTKIDTFYESELRRSKDPHYRLEVETSRSELAALQIKHDRLQSETRNLEAKLASKELQINDLKGEIALYKENETRQAALIASLKERLRIIETETGSLETAQSRGEIAIATLQRDTKDQNARILELEALIRSIRIERDEAVQKAIAADRKYTELNLEVCNALGIEGSLLAGGHTAKLSDLVQENLLLRGKLTTLTDHLSSAELESKASRETIMRLVSEISREQKSTSSTILSIESLRSERDSSILRRNELEREVQLLKERINANQRAWDSTRMELEQRDTRVTSMDRELKNHQYNAQVAMTTLKAFKESLATILSDSYFVCSDSEDAIKERVTQLQVKDHQKYAQVDILDNKVRSLNDQLDSQVKLYQAAINRAKEAEDELDLLKARLSGVEGELTSTAVFRDGLRSEKERRLAAIMKMDHMALDVGFDMTGDALMSRAEQLVRLEGDAVHDKTTAIYNLQRKVKNLKEQLESKDLHLDLLRKKINNLEGGLVGRSDLQKDRDDLDYSYRRVRKENERLRGLLGTARETIRDLKAQLLDTSNLKLMSLQQREKIEILVNEIDKLEKTREKQARKLTGIKQELVFTEHETTEERSRISLTLGQLENELRATKALLEETARRERQLVDFRQVVARMLGMDINTLAVPDYEIIARMEKLIQAHHTHALTTHSLEHSLTDLDPALGLGPSPRRSRARSLSPSRRRHIHTTKY